jgi:hypothetical protein
LLIDRFPFSTSETTLLDANTGIRSRCRMPRSSMRTRRASIGSAWPRPARQFQITPGRKDAGKAGFLRHIADAPLESREIVMDPPAPVEELAIRRLDEAGHHLDRGGFPAPLRPRNLRISPGLTVKLTCLTAAVCW